MKKLFKYLLSILAVSSLCSCGFYIPIDPPGSERHHISTDSSASSVQKDGYAVYDQLDYTLTDMYRNSYYQNALPSSGQCNLLVIPVLFTDSELSDNSAVRQDINMAFFGDSDELAWESVKSYYEKESLGKLSISGAVTDWYESNQTAAYYGIDSDSTRTINLLQNAVSWASSNQGIDISDYDTDSDGYIDSVIMIYGYKDYSTLGNKLYSNLWAYCYYTLEKPSPASPVPNAFMWASYDFMYSSDSEDSGIDAHTYIHEMGHLFGLDDLYDYNNAYSPAGGWTMQDENVGSHDPLSRLLLGWYRHLYVPYGDSEFSISTLEAGDIVLLSSDFRNSPFDEYYLLDFYSPTGLNAYDVENNIVRPEIASVDAYGCRIWHVDARLVNMYISGDTIYQYKSPITNPYVSSGFVMLGNSNSSKKNGTKRNSYINDSFYLLQLVKDHSTSIIMSSKFFREDDLFKTGDTYGIGILPNKKKSMNWMVSFQQESENEYKIVVSI